MTNESLLKKLNVIYESIDTDNYIKSQIADLIKDVKEDICAKSMKSKGKASVYSAAKRVTKSAIKLGKGKVDGAVIIDGSQYVMDCYRMLRFNEPMELPKLPDYPNKFSYEKTLNQGRTSAIEINLPTVGELKAAVKIHKAEYVGRPKDYKPGLWLLQMYDDTPICVNSQYLLDMLEALPDCKCYANGSRYGTLYFEADNGEGLLITVKPKNQVFMNVPNKE